MCLCYQEPAPGYISKLISARRAYHLGSCIAYSSSSPVFTSLPPAAPVLSSLRRSCFFLEVQFPVVRCCSCTALFVSTKRRTAASCFPGGPIPIRPLLFLYHLACVHQEDRSSSLVGSRPLLKNVLTNALSVSSQHFDYHCNIFIVIVIYLAAFWLPKSLDYSGHAIQVHTQERTIQVHTQECAIQVHTQERAIQVDGIFVHNYRAPLVLVHYSCTATYFHAPISCTTRNRALLSCTPPTRAPLVLVHHSVISCTTHAPLCTLMHPSCASLVLVQQSHAPLLLMHHSRAPLLLVHHSFSCTILHSCTAP